MRDAPGNYPPDSSPRSRTLPGISVAGPPTQTARIAAEYRAGGLGVRLPACAARTESGTSRGRPLIAVRELSAIAQDQLAGALAYDVPQTHGPPVVGVRASQLVVVFLE